MALKQPEYSKGGLPVPFALEIRDVHKAFQHADGNSSMAAHKVLSGVDLKVREGEFVTIVGPSGCGKTTLLNIVAGLDSPDSGALLIRGEADTSKTRRIVIFQEGALFPWLSVRENVEFGLKAARMPEEHRRETTARYLELVGLERFSESFVYQLSGGMKQRVAIARALAMEPEILLMDEPFAALDVQTREQLYDELVGLHKATGKTILFITHNINEALLLGDRVIILSSIIRNIKREFEINAPRPRDPENPQLREIKRQILREFEQDFQSAKRGLPESSGISVS